MHAQEAVGQDAAFQEGPELALDKAGYRPVPFLLPDQEGLQVFGNDLIQERLIRMAGLVGGSEAHASSSKAYLRPLSRSVSRGIGRPVRGASVSPRRTGAYRIPTIPLIDS